VTSDERKTAGYRDLLVWQKGIALAKSVYQVTATFPSEEKFGLVSQMRRAAVSVPSNVAEGQARRTTGEFIQFVSNAEGSVAELDTQVTLCEQFGYCGAEAGKGLNEKLDELRRMLNSLRRKLASR
jgi:four helix bundle protein